MKKKKNKKNICFTHTKMSKQIYCKMMMMMMMMMIIIIIIIIIITMVMMTLVMPNY